MPITNRVFSRRRLGTFAIAAGVGVALDRIPVFAGRAPVRPGSQTAFLRDVERMHWAYLDKHRL